MISLILTFWGCSRVYNLTFLKYLLYSFKSPNKDGYFIETSVAEIIK